MRIKFIFLFLLAALFANAQEKNSLTDMVKRGMKFDFTEDGKNYAKIGVGSQIWARYVSLNEGIKDFEGGETIHNDFDIALRRITFSATVKFDRFLLFTNVGVGAQPNNKSTSKYIKGGKNAEFFLYDAWASYQLMPKYLTMGMGLNMYNGLSRYSSATSSGTLGIDVQNIASPEVTTTYQASRQLGIFATGKLGKFDYRLSLAKPFIVSTLPEDHEYYTAYEHYNRKMAFKGYFTYQFWEQESNEKPFTKGTYVGEKKVLNIGAGFEYQPDATVSKETNIGTNNFIKHDRKHFAVDVFMDLPMANNSALTAYVAGFKFDYGPDYLIQYGTMDTYGGQIAEPQHGTGNALNIQVGYLIPNKNKDAVRIQPYYTMTSRDFEALGDAATHHNFGSNFYFIGHKAKFGLEYQIRPVFKKDINDTYRLEEHKGMFIAKMAFSI